MQAAQLYAQIKLVQDRALIAAQVRSSAALHMMA